jgi:hypothetical protein
LRKVAAAVSLQLVSASTPLELTPEDRLDVLRYLDEFHYWHSLDDKRHCKRCGRSITGRQILIIEFQGARGKFRLRCPTVACVSSPSEWIYADPVLAAKLRSDFRPGRSTFEKGIALPLIHDGHAQTVRQPRRKYVAAAGKVENGSLPAPVSFRATVAGLKLLRTVATGLHAIHPIA